MERATDLLAVRVFDGGVVLLHEDALHELHRLHDEHGGWGSTGKGIRANHIDGNNSRRNTNVDGLKMIKNRYSAIEGVKITTSIDNWTAHIVIPCCLVATMKRGHVNLRMLKFHSFHNLETGSQATTKQ